MKEMVEMDRFWNDMERNLDSVSNGYRLCILEVLNGWIGYRTRASITGAFGAPGENDNGKECWSFVQKGDCV